MTTAWTVENWGERNGHPDVCLRDERWETTVELDRDGELRIEHDVESDSYGGGTRNVVCRLPVAEVIRLLAVHGYVVALPGGRAPSPTPEER